MMPWLQSLFLGVFLLTSSWSIAPAYANTCRRQVFAESSVNFENLEHRLVELENSIYQADPETVDQAEADYLQFAQRRLVHSARIHLPSFEFTQITLRIIASANRIRGTGRSPLISLAPIILEASRRLHLREADIQTLKLALARSTVRTSGEASRSLKEYATADWGQSHEAGLLALAVYNELDLERTPLEPHELQYVLEDIRDHAEKINWDVKPWQLPKRIQNSEEQKPSLSYEQYCEQELMHLTQTGVTSFDFTTIAVHILYSGHRQNHPKKTLANLVAQIYKWGRRLGLMKADQDRIKMAILETDASLYLDKLGYAKDLDWGRSLEQRALDRRTWKDPELQKVKAATGK